MSSSHTRQAGCVVLARARGVAAAGNGYDEGCVVSGEEVSAPVSDTD